MKTATIRRTTEEEKARFAKHGSRRGWAMTLNNGAVRFSNRRDGMNATIKFLRTQGYTIKEAA